MDHCPRKIDIGFLQTTPPTDQKSTGRHTTLDKIPWFFCSSRKQDLLAKKSPAFKNDTLQDFSEIFTITVLQGTIKIFNFFSDYIHAYSMRLDRAGITSCDVSGEKAYSTRQKHENDLLNKMQKYQNTFENTYRALKNSPI